MIIGIIGKKGSGKTTAGNLLEEQDFVRMSFADTLKKMTHVLLTDLGMDPRESYEHIYGDRKEELIPKLGVSARHIMQTLGTEWGRQLIHPDIWIMTTESSLGKLIQGTNVVFDDVRFNNEGEMILRLDGTLVQLLRDNDGQTDLHDSEKGLTLDGIEVIDNNGSIDDLIDKLAELTNPL